MATASSRVGCGKWHLPAAEKHLRGPFRSSATRYAPSTSPVGRDDRRQHTHQQKKMTGVSDDPVDLSAAWRERNGWRGWRAPDEKSSGGGQVPLARANACRAGLHSDVPNPARRLFSREAPAATGPVQPPQRRPPSRDLLSHPRRPRVPLPRPARPLPPLPCLPRLTRPLPAHPRELLSTLLTPGC